MKLILSRKGFDSSAGGVASPIFPDGTMISLPIPDQLSPIRYRDIELRGHSLGRVVSELTRTRQRPEAGAHLDPDLVASAYPRKPGWRAIFGQAGGEQTVLARDEIGPGDLFLFFGWFRRVERSGGVLRFAKGTPDLHVLWGWLQVDHVLDVATSKIPTWAAYHPHVAAAGHRSNNALYVARETLVVDGLARGVAGAGVFATYDERLRLTKPGTAKRSLWSLPAWFEPAANRPALGYHREPSRWTRRGEHVELQSVGRGQEFVLDTTHYPEAIPWLGTLLDVGGRDCPSTYA